MKSKHLVLALAFASVFVVAGIAWTEYAHRPRDVVLRVDGIHCEYSCAPAVRESVEKLAGVSDVSVSVEEGEVRLTLDGWSKTRLEDITAAVEAAGPDFKVVD